MGSSGWLITLVATWVRRSDICKVYVHISYIHKYGMFQFTLYKIKLKCCRDGIKLCNLTDWLENRLVKRRCSFISPPKYLFQATEKVYVDTCSGSVNQQIKKNEKFGAGKLPYFKARFDCVTFGYLWCVSSVCMVLFVNQCDLQKICSSTLNKTGPQRDAFYTQLRAGFSDLLQN